MLSPSKGKAKRQVGKRPFTSGGARTPLSTPPESPHVSPSYGGPGEAERRGQAGERRAAESRRRPRGHWKCSSQINHHHHTSNSSTILVSRQWKQHRQTTVGPVCSSYTGSRAESPKSSDRRTIRNDTGKEGR